MEQTVLSLAKQRQILRASDLQEQGLSSVILSRLVSKGKLERVARGIYSLAHEPISEHRSLAEASALVPRGTICLLSALRFYNISTQAPFEVWIAIPHHMLSPRIDRPALRIIRMSGKSLTEGINHTTIDGVSISVYSPAKTVADCFKFRNKIGLDVALEALRESWQQREVTMDELWHYAAINRVANVMRPYLEALTA